MEDYRGDQNADRESLLRARHVVVCADFEYRNMMYVVPMAPNWRSGNADRAATS